MKKRATENHSDVIYPKGKIYTSYQRAKLNDVIACYRIANSKYNDVSKMQIYPSYKGNWCLAYDSKDTGLVIDGSMISTYMAKKLGIFVACIPF